MFNMISVKNLIDNYNLIKNADVIGCATSGGSDSMALLHFLMQLRKEYDFKLVCINVEHGIRGTESINDSNFVKQYCKKNDIDYIFTSFKTLDYAKQNKLNIEQSARILRYKFFYSLLEDKKCNKIFTAHNKNDNAETILLNVFRGSGNKGLCGMDIDNGKGIYRPMLLAEKKEILNYINQNNINYVTDSTNKDNSYSRNYIRNKIFPDLEKRYKTIYENITRMGNIVKEEYLYLNDLSKKNIVFNNDSCYIKLPCDNVLLKRAIFLCCDYLGVKKDIFNKNIEDIVNLTQKSNGSFITLTKINVYKEYDKLHFEKRENDIENNINIPFSCGNFAINEYIIEITKTDIDFKNIKYKKDVFYADLDKIKNDSVFRYRQNGDNFKRFKGGRKSLSDYLTDIKIPKRKRDNILLLCNKSNVLIAFCYDISDDIKIDGNTKNAIKITYRRKNQ